MWIDRCLLLGPRVAVVSSQREFQRVVRRLGIDDADPYCDPRWNACVHAYEADGELVCVVGLNASRLRQMDGIDAAAVLVHEAVHVWQRVRDALGPGDLGKEMEAYAVQNLAAGLMRAYITSSSPVVAAGARASA